MRARQIAALQAKVDRIVRAPLLDGHAEKTRASLSSPEDDAFLPEGLPSACIHDIEGADWDVETGIAPASFAAAMLARVSEGAILWTIRDISPFVPRLQAFGLDPDRLLFCLCRNDNEALDVMEDALRAPGVTAAVGEVEQVTLTQSRRLHLVCERAGNMGLLLRRRFFGGTRSPKQQSAAVTTRWRIRFARTETKEPGLGFPRWQLDLLYIRGGRPSSFLVEWSDDQRRLRVVTNAEELRMPDAVHAQISA